MNVPLSDEIAQKLSDQLGYREGPLDATRVKVLEPAELAGPDFRDIILVQATNTKPVKIRKGFAWQDPALTALMGGL
jgi:type IV secretion system protein VirD4